MLWNRRSLLMLALLAILLPTVLGGCSHSDGRKSVRGIVTLNGKPLADAMISFQAADGSTGNSAGTVLDSSGAFLIAADKGLLPGKYAVNIQAWRETDRTYRDPISGQLVKITAPILFKETGKLEATVAGDNDNTFDFRLTSVK